MIDIRIFGKNGKYVNEEGTKSLIKNILDNPGCCDTIWLTTAAGWPDLDVHRSCAEKLGEAAKLYRENGINVSLQFACTLGHGVAHTGADRSGIMQKGKKTPFMVGGGGEVAEYSFCYYNEDFREYIRNAVSCYAFIKPQTLWIEDDLRATNHMPAEYTCFCDDCIKRFNETYGSSFTREELVYEINFGELIWRERYMKQIRQGMYEFTRMIAEAFLKISPDSAMAVQYGRFQNYVDSDYNYLFEALHDAGAKKIKSRPGGGFYWDKNPMEMLKKALELNAANAVLHDYVTDNYPEIENLPDVAFGKSCEGTCKEAALQLAYGCNGLTFAAINRGDEVESYNDTLYGWFAKYRPYWDRLIEHNRGTKCGGIAFYSTVNAYKKKLVEGDRPFSWSDLVGVWDTTFLKIGVPLSNDMSHAKVFMLDEKTVDYITDEDIENLLEKPVIAGGKALEKIIARGYGDRVSCNISVLSGSECRGREVFTEHIVNKGFEGDFCNESFFVKFSTPEVYVMTDKNGDTQELGKFEPAEGDKASGASSAIVSTYDKSGKKLSEWAVFGYNYGIDIISSKKRNQIINAADYLCEMQLPAKLISPEQIVVIPRVDSEGKTVSLSLQSCSIGTSGTLEAVIRNPKHEKFTVMSAKNEETEIDFAKDGEDYKVILPPVGPWEMITVFC